MGQDTWPMASLDENYKDAIEWVIRKRPMTITNIDRLLRYAKKQKFEALSMINRLSIANPKVSFKLLCACSSKYNDSKEVIEYLEKLKYNNT